MAEWFDVVDAGLDRDVARLANVYEEVTKAGRGQIVFVAGDDDSGRNELLRAFSSHAKRFRPHGVTISGGFEGGQYSAWDTEGRSDKVMSVVEQVLTVAEPVASLAEVLVPFAGLLGQILSKSNAALQLAASLRSERERLDLTVLMPQLLSNLCETEGPVACIVNNAHEAPGGWWSDLLLLFARRIARRWPCL